MKKNIKYKSVQNIISKWNKEEESYRKLGKIIDLFLTTNIYETELNPVISYRVKELSSLIKTSLKKNKSYRNINDKLGFRLVCHYQSELKPLHEFIDKYFHIIKYEPKLEIIKFNELGYSSDHYDVTLKNENILIQCSKKLKKLKFEIQIRTLCQHAWADVAHELVYKQDEESLSKLNKRKIFRLTSLFEIADDDFNNINKEITESENFTYYKILKAIEGRFYRYAKRGYDIEFSYMMISFFKPLILTQEINVFLKSLEKFIEEQEIYIKKIYEERKNIIETNIFLSQPEFFIILYFIEKDQYLLKNMWIKYFDLQELVDISIWYGNPLNLSD